MAMAAGWCGGAYHRIACVGDGHVGQRLCNQPVLYFLCVPTIKRHGADASAVAYQYDRVVLFDDSNIDDTATPVVVEKVFA